SSGDEVGPVAQRIRARGTGCTEPVPGLNLVQFSSLKVKTKPAIPWKMGGSKLARGVKQASDSTITLQKESLSDNVFVAVKAEREVSKAAMVWALAHVVRPGDSITLLALLAGGNHAPGEKTAHGLHVQDRSEIAASPSFALIPSSVSAERELPPPMSGGASVPVDSLP
ncbi:hypothetical protein GOBAR_AA03553, partial [Gossypium barbadense]